MHHFSVLFLLVALFALLMLGTTRGNDFDGTIARTRTRTRTRKGGGYVDDYDFDATVDDDARFGGGVQPGRAAESSERNSYSLSSSSTTRQKSRRKSTSSSSSSISVLQNARKSDVRLHPYPHVVIENCLPDDVYEELEKFYPKHKDIVQVA